MGPKYRKPSHAVKQNEEPTSTGISIYFKALIFVSLVILCNWLIDFEYYLNFYRIQPTKVVNKNSVNKTSLRDLAERKKPPSVTNSWIKISTNKLKTVKWAGRKTMSDVIQLNEPVQINTTILNDWPMFQWSLLDIANNSSFSLNGTRWQPIPLFVLGRERDKGGMIGSPRDHPLSYTNVSLLQFLQSTFDPKTYLYWTGELSVWESHTGTSSLSNTNDSAIDHDFNDWRDFRIREEGISASETTSEDDLWRPMLWLSHPGVVAQTHYDTQHNVFIQIQGTKRFLLFPPGTELYSYPHIHRSYRQSQVHFELDRHATHDNNQTKDFHLVHPSNVTAYEIILGPGDVLYIPPYWQHRVESLTLSVSLSILSPARIAAALAEVYWENVPFGVFQSSRDLRTRAVGLYLSLLIDKLPGTIVNTTLQQFAENLYDTRFAPLNIRHKVFNTDGVCFGPADDNTTALIDTHREQFELAANNIATMMSTIEAHSAIKMIFIRDYVEEIVRWAVGPDYTARHIKDCLR